MKNTNVICPNCGTKFALPEHEHQCSGVAIGKDSGLGDIYLTPEYKETKKVNKAEERLATLKAAGYDVSNYMVLNGANGEGFLFENRDGVPVPVDMESPVVSKIKESGYVFNRYTNPRWITGQMFHMLNYKPYWYENTSPGYESALNSKGYDYQFIFIKEELNRLAKMEKSNDVQFKNRSMFFDIETVGKILDDYLYMLKKKVEYIKPAKCKGQPYKEIPHFKYGTDSKGNKVFLTDIEKKVYLPIKHDIEDIKRSKSFAEVSWRYSYFYSRHFIPLDFGGKKQSKVFRDTYKGLGAYYTCDNLIKFHGCCVYDDYGKYDQEHSLDILNTKAKVYKGDYWRLFAFMKQLIADNNFVPDWRVR